MPPASPTTRKEPVTPRRYSATPPAAARRASALGSHSESAAQYARAFRFGDGLAESARSDLLERLSYEYYLTGEFDRALETQKAALELRRLAGDPVAEADALRTLSRLLRYSGSVDEAFSTAPRCGRAARGDASRSRARPWPTAPSRISTCRSRTSRPTIRVGRKGARARRAARRRRASPVRARQHGAAGDASSRAGGFPSESPRSTNEHDGHGSTSTQAGPSSCGSGGRPGAGGIEKRTSTSRRASSTASRAASISGASTSSRTALARCSTAGAGTTTLRDSAARHRRPAQLADAEDRRPFRARPRARAAW